MRKTLLFALALLFATATMAQNRAVLLKETFDDSSMPSGWSISAQNSNWSVSSTNNAGGDPNEMLLYYYPSFNGVTRLVTPAIDLTGAGSVVFSFKHTLDNYSGSHILGISTSSDGGTTWNDGWTQSYSSSGSWEVTQEIVTADMGQPNVKFSIFYQGNSYNINNWYFDDITIFTLENIDLGIDAIDVDNFINYGFLNVGMKLRNYGQTDITSLTATYEISGMEPVTETIDVNIPSMGISNVGFATPTFLDPDNYTITITLDAINGSNDDFDGNNTLSKNFAAAVSSVQKTPMIEHFTSSTCGPCVSVNNTMLTFTNNNAGRYTYTKYQMNWPGSGDPYYTAEGGTRRSYYNVGAVPDIYLDGEPNTPVTQNVFDSHANKPAFFDIRSSYNVEGNTINVVVDIMPYVDADARVFVSVNEKLTTGNVGSNGETSFRHVMMKMLPNAGGSTISFTSAELQRLEFSQDLSSTHVEEMSDLEVAVWIQNYTTKEVYNSRYAYEYTDEHPYPVENLTLNSDLVASWNAPENGNLIGYDVYFDNQLVEEGITETSYAFDSQTPDATHIAGVVALYADGKSSVKTVSMSGTLQDMGLITEEQNFVLNVENPDAELRVSNANHNSHQDINILSVEEVNEEGTQYLMISNEELPYALPYGEDFSISFAAIAPEAKSVAQTKIVVTSDAGTLEFAVSVDGEVLSVSEVASEAQIHPNPTSGNVRIVANNSIESVTVYDMMGAQVAIVPANGKSVNVNMSQFSNGVYFFNIRQSNGVVSNQRVVVSH